MVSFVDSLVAPMSLLNALIVAVSNRNRCRVEQTFRKLETLWDNSDVYKKDVCYTDNRGRSSRNVLRRPRC